MDVYWKIMLYGLVLASVQHLLRIAMSYGPPGPRTLPPKGSDPVEYVYVQVGNTTHRIADPSPETTALLDRLDRELAS